MRDTVSVSIPSGLPRPFSQPYFGANAVTVPFQSRPGLPGHFALSAGIELRYTDANVSIPTGLPWPSSPIFASSAAPGTGRFNPDWAPQAISPATLPV